MRTPTGWCANPAAHSGLHSGLKAKRTRSIECRLIDAGFTEQLTQAQAQAIVDQVEPVNRDRQYPILQVRLVNQNRRRWGQYVYPGLIELFEGGQNGPR